MPTASRPRSLTPTTRGRLPRAELLQGDVGPAGSYGRLAELGYGPVRFTEDVTVRMPDDAERRTLDLEPSQPVFEIWHIAYAADALAAGAVLYFLAPKRTA